MINKYGLLYIEPEGKCTGPIIDTFTRRMTYAFYYLRDSRGVWQASRNLFREGEIWRGHHRCSCGAKSTIQDYKLHNGLITNFLCMHYLACHREEVPESELGRVLQLTDKEESPTYYAVRYFDNGEPVHIGDCLVESFEKLEGKAKKSNR